MFHSVFAVASFFKQCFEHKQTVSSTFSSYCNTVGFLFPGPLFKTSTRCSAVQNGFGIGFVTSKEMLGITSCLQLLNRNGSEWIRLRIMVLLQTSEAIGPESLMAVLK